MAERLADIVAQIENVRQLESVVTAMRGIAASRAQQGRSLLAGIEGYTQVISGAIGEALSLMPPQDGPAPARIRHGGRCLILLSAEQGFAGAFSERVLDAVKDDIVGATIFLMGTRGLAVAEERGIRPVWHAPMATSAAAIPAWPTGLRTPSIGRSRTEATSRFPIRLQAAVCRSTGILCGPSTSPGSRARSALASR
jgi:F-type H+-transporting ATPase subunit gamma